MIGRVSLADILPLVVFCGALPLALGVGIAAAAAKARAKARERLTALTRWARTRAVGVRSSRAEGGTISFVAAGSSQDVRFELNAASSGLGRKAARHTRIRCRPKRAYAPTVIARRQAKPGPPPPGSYETWSGDAAFDALYSIHTQDGDDTMSWLGPRLRATLVAQRQPWTVKASSSEVVLASETVVTAEEELDRAVWVATILGQTTAAATDPMRGAATKVCPNCSMVFLAGEVVCPSCGARAR